VNKTNTKLGQLRQPSEYLLSDKVNSSVLRTEMNLPLQPGIGSDYKACRPVLTPMAGALTVVGGARHGRGTWGGGCAPVLWPGSSRPWLEAGAWDGMHRTHCPLSPLQVSSYRAVYRSQ
jgi:hypothetical protein